jgi:hypothetical protein
MRGSPITRLVSRDGRWAYTLYDGGGATPFVHALDTSNRLARCIDLPMLKGYGKLWQLRFTPSGGPGALRLGLPGSPPLLEIETVDFRVSAPAAEAAAPSATDRPWLVPLGVVLVLFTVLAGGVAIRRRARGRPVHA